MSDIIIKVEGMGCQGCITSVTKAVNAVAPGAAVTVSLDAGTVRVSEVTVAREALEAAIAKAGYDIGH